LVDGSRVPAKKKVHFLTSSIFEFLDLKFGGRFPNLSMGRDFRRWVDISGGFRPIDNFFFMKFKFCLFFCLPNSARSGPFSLARGWRGKSLQTAGALIPQGACGINPHPPRPIGRRSPGPMANNTRSLTPYIPYQELGYY
jgi:hypothetical protein